MALSQNQKLLAALVVIAIIGWLLWKCSQPKENFTYANAIEEDPGTYDLRPQDYEMLGDNGFADLVAPAERPRQEKYGGQGVASPAPYAEGKRVDLPIATRPFDNDYDAQQLMPDDVTSATLFDQDVCDPEVYLYRTANRAQIKSRQHETADFFRGDLPIKPCKRGWFDSRYGEGDSKLDGYFSEFTNSKFQALCGQKSMPQSIANEELIMDYNPMDNY